MDIDKFKISKEYAENVLELAIKKYDDITPIIKEVINHLDDKVHDSSDLLYKFRDYINPHEINECHHEIFIDSDIYTEGLIINGSKYNNKKKTWNVKIEVVEPEGNGFPHFHLVDLNSGKKTAILLNKPMYFIHDSYTKKLNNDEREKLVFILNSKFKNMPQFTVWQMLCIQWNMDELHDSISIELSDMPDYMELKDSCH